GCGGSGLRVGANGRQRQDNHARENEHSARHGYSPDESAAARGPVALYAAGLKYSTIAAPIDARTNPAYSIGLIADFGGWITIVSSTLMMGAPPKTSGMTYTGRPPDLNAQMMHAAPAAPSAPAIVAVTRPVVSKCDSDPCDARAATGISTPIRKYATPTQSSAFSGLP